MAANLKKSPDKKEEKAAGKSEKGERFSIDLKWVAMGLAMVFITICSVIVGIQLAPTKVITQTNIETKYVKELPLVPGPSVPLMASQIVNLNGGRYLRFSVVLQYTANEKIWPPVAAGGHGVEKGPNPLESYEPMMKDTVVSGVSMHSAQDLLNPLGKEKLKEELKEALNHQFQMLGGHGGANDEHPHPIVLRVYFTEFVVS